MSLPAGQSVLAVDVGSSWVKLGWFPSSGACASTPLVNELQIAAPPLPAPEALLRVEHARREPSEWLGEIDRGLAELPLAAAARCLMGSVHRAAAATLQQHLERSPWTEFKQLTRRDLPLEVRVAEPDRVGIDRLLGAVAVNRLRPPHTAAISVDVGTAMTVNLIGADGAFEGGAIMAGPVISLLALHKNTASLPALAARLLAEAPAAVGKNTEQAMAAGAYWGGIGAINELLERVAAECGASPEVFLTGGGSLHFADHIHLHDRPARRVPHLVLAGIRVTAEALDQR
jgi:type III pantothenate kinase